MLAFTGLYLAVMAFLGRGAGAGQQVMYFGLLALLIPVLYVVHRRHSLGAPLLWCFSFWGLAHLAGGLLPPPGAALQPHWPWRLKLRACGADELLLDGQPPPTSSGVKTAQRPLDLLRALLAQAPAALHFAVAAKALLEERMGQRLV